MNSAATLNGHRLTHSRVNIPAWGCWYAEASLDAEVTLSGRVTLQVADLSLSGTILSGGLEKGRSTYRIVAGAGGWGRTIPRKSYTNDASEKLSKVLGDAATEVGETLAAIASTERVGPGYTRPEGPASRALELEARGNWYVDEAGVTRIGTRTAGVLVGKVTRIEPADLTRGKVVLAAESIATILPGVVVDEITAVDVEHEISASKGLRSTLWGKQAKSSLEGMRLLLEQLDPDRRFRGVTEYRVVSLEGKRVNLQPVQVSSGMPDLRRVLARPGVPGCEANVALGSRVLVGFVNSDPGRPFVASFEDAEGEGFLPTELKIVGGILGVARMTDPVIAGPFTGSITMGSTKVKCG